MRDGSEDGPASGRAAAVPGGDPGTIALRAAGGVAYVGLVECVGVGYASVD